MARRILYTHINQQYSSLYADLIGVTTRAHTHAVRSKRHAFDQRFYHYNENVMNFWRCSKGKGVVERPLLLLSAR